MGKGLSAIAHSEDHLVEAFCNEQYHFLVGVQWHPEFLIHGGDQKIFAGLIAAAS